MLLFAVTVSLAAPTLSLSGSCPGAVDFDITGATPGGSVAVLSASGPGSAPLPAGPCSELSGLDASGLTLRSKRTADGAGDASFSPSIPVAACGAWVQVVDVATCTMSEALPISSTPDCSFVADPDLAVGEPSNLAGTTAAHNAWRDLAGVPRVVWNVDLAQSAQDYADTCPTIHDASRSPDAGFGYVGENLYWSFPTGSGPQAVASWASERADYDFGVAIDYTNYLIFGHYTQIVWAETEAIGCGYADCTASTGVVSVVCRYGEGGNYIGQTPYDFTADSCVDLDNDDALQWEDIDDEDRSVQ